MRSLPGVGTKQKCQPLCFCWACVGTGWLFFLQKDKWYYLKASKAWQSQPWRFGQAHSPLLQSLPALVADATQEWQGLMILSSAPRSLRTWSPRHSTPEISQTIPCSGQFFFFPPGTHFGILKHTFGHSLCVFADPLCGKCFIVFLLVFTHRGLTFLSSFPYGSPEIKLLFSDSGIPRGNPGTTKSVGFPYSMNCGTHSHHVSDLRSYLF